MSRLRQQEQADLLNVTPCRDMNQILILIRIEWIRASELVQSGKHFFKIPWILKRDRMQSHDCFGTHAVDIAGDQLSHIPIARFMQEFKATDQQIVVLTSRHRRSPA